jgi:hypothetical protein
MFERKVVIKKQRGVLNIKKQNHLFFLFLPKAVFEHVYISTTQIILLVLHSVLIKVHEDTDISPYSVIYRPIGSTMQLVTKLSSPNFAVFQDHRYLESSIVDVTETLRVKRQHPNSHPPHTSNSTYVGIHLYILGV